MCGYYNFDNTLKNKINKKTIFEPKVLFRLLSENSIDITNMYNTKIPHKLYSDI